MSGDALSRLFSEDRPRAELGDRGVLIPLMLSGRKSRPSTCGRRWHGPAKPRHGLEGGGGGNGTRYEGKFIGVGTMRSQVGSQELQQKQYKRSHNGNVITDHQH